MKRGLVLGVGIAVAVVFSDAVLYQTLILPRLREWQSVPLLWWALVESPVIIAIIVAGRVSRGANEILWSSAAATISITAYAAWAAQRGQPGGDLTTPESLDAGLQGAGAVFLVWTTTPGTAPAVIDRLASRARRVVFLSSPHRTPHPFFQQPNPMAVLHADIERLIATAGIASTIIRPGMFASNARLWWAAMIQDAGVVRWPYGAAETAPIDERDVAAVAARVLYEDGHVGADYVLTGPESLSQAEQVSIIGEGIGRRIRFQELSPEEFRRETAGRWPGPIVDMLLAAWGATIGRPAFVTATVADVIGSPARTFRQWVVDHAEAFQGHPSGPAARVVVENPSDQ